MTQSKVTQLKAAPEPSTHEEKLVLAIKTISMFSEKLSSAGLTQRAIVVLLHDILGTRVPKTVIKEVLDGMPLLQQHYLTKKAPK